MFMRSAPLEYKYKHENIPAAIARAISDTEKRNEKGRMHYREILSRVEQLLHHSLSDRQLTKNLSMMVYEKLLNRYDPTGKRGSKVYFSLTEKGQKKYGLKILGTNIEAQRRKRLYCLLFFFEVYKRTPLLTEKQLSRVLKVIGSSMNDLERIQGVKMPQNAEISAKSIKGVDVLFFPLYNPKTKSKKMSYYVVIPGFSVEEFITYQLLLKDGIAPRPFAPRPFSHYATFRPFVFHSSYTKKEVEEAVFSFVESGIIQPIDPIIPGEKRYNIVDQSLRELAYAIWLVRMVDYELVIRRLLYDKPTDRDKKYLELYLGKSSADKMIAHAYLNRKSYKEERKEHEQAIRELLEGREFFVQEITTNFEKVIQENEIVRDIIEEIFFSPYFLSSASN